MEPNWTAPNLRTGRGGIVHLGVWVGIEVIAACHVNSGLVEPGPWTNDPVTCKYCRARLRRSPQLRKPELTTPLSLVRRRTELFREAMAFDTGYPSWELCFSDAPGDRELWKKWMQLREAMRGLAAQCMDRDDFDIARRYITEARQRVVSLYDARSTYPRAA